MNYTVKKFQQAPMHPNKLSATSKWRDLFNSMSPGDWFTLPPADHAKVKSAAQRLLRGRYRLYIDPTNAAQYVFLLVK